MSLPVSRVRALKPLFDRVLVQRIKPAEKTASGILLPSSSAEKVPEATVVATGPGLPHPTTGSIVPPTLKEGDRVLLPAFGGQQVKTDNDAEEFTIYRESEIVAKLTE